MKALLACSLMLLAATASAQTYEETLTRKYRAKLTFANDKARTAVSAYNIDCESPDRRYLPLTNLLYAKMAAADSPEGWLVIRAEARGSTVRIFETFTGPKGPLFTPQLVFELNEWGELKSHVARKEAIMNACFGSHGKIWRMP